LPATEARLQAPLAGKHFALTLRNDYRVAKRIAETLDDLAIFAHKLDFVFSDFSFAI
jgi:hypothetical protein